MSGSCYFKLREGCDPEILKLVNEGLSYLKVDDCFWAYKHYFTMDQVDYSDGGPMYIFMSKTPSQSEWEKNRDIDILRVKKIEYGEMTNKLIGHNYLTRVPALYVESARDGEEYQILHPYTKGPDVICDPFACRIQPKGRILDKHGYIVPERKIKPEYGGTSYSDINFATKGDVYDFVTYFKAKRNKAHQEQEAREAEKRRKEQEEENRRNREINLSMDDIWK